jgi:hypothetical protein
MKKTAIPAVLFFFFVIIITAGYIIPNISSLFAPSQQKNNLETRKTVEDYFTENLHVSSEQAKEMAANGVDLRVSKNATLIGIVDNLYYYGFIDDKDSFEKLLRTTTDTTPGKDGAIKAGNNTIDINSNYSINYSMSDEEIANTLLNKGKFDKNFDRYNYLFMPSGPSR